MTKKSMLITFSMIVLFAVVIMFSGCTSEQTTSTQKGKIIGIEPGAGIMQKTEDAIKDYDLDYTLVSSSSAGMASELTKAINNKKWIVVTGWTPHWKFARFEISSTSMIRKVSMEEKNISVPLQELDLKQITQEHMKFFQSLTGLQRR